MASQYQPEQDPYTEYFQQPQPPPTRNSIVTPIIFLIIFIIAGIALIIFVLYWFLWRGPPPYIVNCEVDTDCFPGNICNKNKGVCEAVPCMVQSDCNAVPGSFCIRNNDPSNKSPGYCQLPACSQNSDCNEDEACLIYDRKYNWGSACVKIGIPCKTKDNCYGGTQQDNENNLICTASGNSDGRCVQCTKNSDCSDTNYCDVDSGLCTNCIQGDDNGCDTGVCGSDGVCCKEGEGPYYNGRRCKIGEEYDYCAVDTDCGILPGGTRMECQSIINDSDIIKICKRPTGCLFSKNTLYNEDNNFIDGIVCTDPETPFCGLDGKCSNISTTTGSVCGAPSKCSNDNYTSTSILCDTTKLTFNNPYQPFCSISADCENYGIDGACIDGLCAESCVNVDGCLVGQYCGGVNSNKTEDCTVKSCYCQYPTEPINCGTTADNADPSICPKSFLCAKNSPSEFLCNFDTTDDNTKYPNLSLVDNYCSTPASNLTNWQNSSNVRGAYCVSGICSQRSGWMGNNCELTKDCMFIEGTVLGQTSFICVPSSSSTGMSICQVPS